MADISYPIIKSCSKQFRKLFRVYAIADNYVRFVAYSTACFSSVDIVKTSKQTYRVIDFVAHYPLHKCADYVSFHSLADLCSYLDTLSSQLV